MKLRIMSDIHIEICNYIIPAMDDDKLSMLILAGDICKWSSSPTSYSEFFNDVCSRFKHVIYVAGNHEYYGGSILTAYDKFVDGVGNHKNLHILNPGHIIIDDVLFVGGTLWTNMNKGDPLSIIVAEKSMNDYYTIRTGDSADKYKFKLKPRDTVAIHNNHINYITNIINEFKTSYNKIVVISHHAPSERSIHPQYVNNPCNPAYYSTLDHIIVDLQPSLWIHGHTHSNFNYMIDDTKVVCNPRGYAKVRNLTLYRQFKSNPHVKFTHEDMYNIFDSENKMFDPFYVEEI